MSTEKETVVTFLTIREFALEAKLSEHAVRNLLSRGEIPGAIRIGRQWRIHKPSWDASVRARVTADAAS